MKREAAFFSVKPGKEGTVKPFFEANTANINFACRVFGAKNASVWTVGNLVYAYGEFEDASEFSLKDLIPKVLKVYLDEISAPGEARLMYHCIGNVRGDKSLIRRRVFATKLKEGCADEYFARHDALVKARGELVPDGPETNFTIHCAQNKYIFGYCELVKSYDHPMTEDEKASTIAWETRQLEIMDWLTDDVDWITGESHPKIQNLFLQEGY